MAKITSDHIPCKIINTSIPRANLFCFENFWEEQEDFLDTVMECWNLTPILGVQPKIFLPNLKQSELSLRTRVSTSQT
jgi:hypothetical protein